MPALAELHAWLLVTQCAVGAGSGTAKAVDHALKRWDAVPARARCRSTTTRSRIPSIPLPSAKRTGYSPARNGPATVPHPSRDCSPQPNSRGLIRCDGRPGSWNVFRRTPPARSTRRCHSPPTLPNAEHAVQVTRLDEYVAVLMQWEWRPGA